MGSGLRGSEPLGWGLVLLLLLMGCPVAEPIVACTAATCDSLGLTCGTADDGCGRQLECGDCQCTPVCAGKSCGPDGCGGQCGTCVDACGVTGQCYSRTPDREWGTPKDEHLLAAAMHPQSGVLWLGGTSMGAMFGPNADGSTDAILFAVPKDVSTIVWSRQWGGVSAGDHVAVRDLATDPAGNLFMVTDTGPTMGDLHAELTKLSADGTELWKQGWTLPANTFAFRGPYLKVAATPAGEALAVGAMPVALNGVSGHGVSDAFVLKYGAAGELKWTQLLGGPSEDAALAAAVDSNGDTYVSGYVGSSVDGHPFGGGTCTILSQPLPCLDAFLWKLDGAGVPVWTRQWGGDDVDRAVAVAVSNGAVYVLSLYDVLVAQRTHLALSRWNKDGVMEWEKEVPKGLDYALAIDQQGRALVAVSDGTTMTLVRVDAAGTVVPLHARLTAGGVGDLVVGPEGQIYVVGSLVPKTGPSTFGGHDAFVNIQ